MTIRVPKWWRVAEYAAQRITRPPADIEACDRAIERQLRQSTVFGVAHAGGEAFSRAWMHSRTRRIVESIRAELFRPERSTAVRVLVVVTAVACLTAAALHRFRSVMP